MMCFVENAEHAERALPKGLEMKEHVPEKEFDQHASRLPFQPSKLKDVYSPCSVLDQFVPGPLLITERYQHEKGRQSRPETSCIAIAWITLAVPRQLFDCGVDSRKAWRRI